ncbi:MAG: hypothetical protein ACE3L7_04320 [Candidatus Pristimantibacillus sp.]
MISIIWFSLLVLLILSYFDQRQSMDMKAWLTIIGTYLICCFYINLFGLLIPVGFIIGLIHVNKKKKYYLSKALIFGLVAVIVLTYAPKIGIGQIKDLSQINQYSTEFNEVLAVSNFTYKSDITSILQTTADHLIDKSPDTTIRADDPHLLFSIWMMNHRNIAIKDVDWLWYKSPLELHYYWQSDRSNENISLEHVIFNDVGYLGVFQRVDGENSYYLKTVIEFDRLKRGNPLIP